MGWSHNNWLARPLEPDEDLKGIAECGLTLACFAEVKELDLCWKYGLKAIISDPRLSCDWLADIDEKKMEENVNSLVEEVGKHPAIFGYFLTDEPGLRPNLPPEPKPIKQFKNREDWWLALGQGMLLELVACQRAPIVAKLLASRIDFST